MYYSGIDSSFYSKRHPFLEICAADPGFGYPRSYLAQNDNEATQSPFWIRHILQVPDEVILEKSGLDAFFFLRYIRILFTIFFSSSLAVIPVLVPLHWLGGNDSAHGVSGLDKLTWANVSPDHAHFYWAHLFLALSVIYFVCYTIYEELVFYVEIRNCFLSSPEHQKLDSATTILITDIPEESLHTLKEIYGIFPGGVHSIKINRDCSALSKKLQAREKVIRAYEVAVIKGMKRAAHSYARGRANSGFPTGKAHAIGKAVSADIELDRSIQRSQGHRWSWSFRRWWKFAESDPKGQYLQELAKLNEDIRQDERSLANLYNTGEASTQFPQEKSAFVRFKTQTAAWMACQILMSSSPFQLLVSHVDISVEDIRWHCLSFSWRERCLRSAVVSVTTISLLILWAVPVAFSGFLSQVTTLAGSVAWLAWLNIIPSWLSGIIQGVLPQLVLTLLTIVLPIMLRAIAVYQGHPTNTSIELSLQRYYFTFLFLQTFLTVSLSSSLTRIAQDVLHGLGSVPYLLAQNLPKTCNYFFSYLIIQGFSVSAATLLQVGPLFTWLVISPLLDSSPRAKWQRLKRLPETQWGTVFPLYTTLACIGRFPTNLFSLPPINAASFRLFSHCTTHTSLWRCGFRPLRPSISSSPPSRLCGSLRHRR